MPTTLGAVTNLTPRVRPFENQSSYPRLVSVIIMNDRKCPGSYMYQLRKFKRHRLYVFVVTCRTHCQAMSGDYQMPQPNISAYCYFEGWRAARCRLKTLISNTLYGPIVPSGRILISPSFYRWSPLDCSRRWISTCKSPWLGVNRNILAWCLEMNLLDY